MGTNYFVTYNECGECGRYDKYHIGKNSAGWTFSLHVDPEKNINNFNDIKSLMKKGKIYDEYGMETPYEEMISIITEKSWNRRWDTSILKKLGYNSKEDFLYKNNAVEGPKGLLRHKISDHCIGHGKGTYDYIIGTFR